MSHRVIENVEGANDGFVAVDSAKWKDDYFVGPVLDLDHLNFLGWWEPAELDLFGGKSKDEFEDEARSFYLQLAQSLP